MYKSALKYSVKCIKTENMKILPDVMRLSVYTKQYNNIKIKLIGNDM